MQPLWGHSEASDLSRPASTVWAGGQLPRGHWTGEFETLAESPNRPMTSSAGSSLSDPVLANITEGGGGRYCFNNPPSRQDPYRTPSQP
jgi:hypothetical protein